MHAPETRQRRRRAPYIITTAAAVLAIALGAGGWALFIRKGEQRPPTLTLSGHLYAPAGAIKAAEPCTADDYPDVQPGAQVTVTDETGRVIALGKLGTGLGEWVERGQFSGVLCTYRFVIADVPGDRTYYGVEVAHRGKVRFTRAQVDREVEITLGLG